MDLDAELMPLAPRQVRDVLRDHGPIGLDVAVFFGLEGEELRYASGTRWGEVETEAVSGTPDRLEGQRNTFEGMNLALLREARRHQSERIRSRLAATLACIAVTAGILIFFLSGEWAAGVVWGLFTGAALCVAVLSALFLELSVLGSILGWFEPSVRRSVQAALATMPLTFLPGEALRSGPLWDLGLGKRLATYSPEAREVMGVLSEESGMDVRKLAEMAASVTQTSGAA